MTLEAAFTALLGRLAALGEALAWLRTTIGDAPDEAHRLPGGLGDGADELIGLLAEAAEPATAAREALPRLDRAARGLAACHEAVNRLTARMHAGLFAYEPAAELRRAGRALGPAWGAWARVVSQAAEECRQPLEELHAALPLAWQELAERRGPAVLVTNTSVGQQIVAPEAAPARLP